MCVRIKSFDSTRPSLLKIKIKTKHATPGIGALPILCRREVTARNVRRLCKAQYANKSPTTHPRSYALMSGLLKRRITVPSSSSPDYYPRSNHSSLRSCQQGTGSRHWHWMCHSLGSSRSLSQGYVSSMRLSAKSSSRNGRKGKASLPNGSAYVASNRGCG